MDHHHDLVFKIGEIEGPFDVLLDLVQEKQLDLTSVSLKSVTDDFLKYIEQSDIPPSVKGDFLVVAATLLLIKAKQLLPSLTEEEEEEIQQLTDRVRLYQLYREQSAAIQTAWGKTPLYPAHFWADIHPYQAPAPQVSIHPDQLFSAFQKVIAKLPKVPNPRAHLVKRSRSLEECISLFTERLQRVNRLIFQDSIVGETPQAIAVSFLAILEMAKKQQVTLLQAEAFDKLEITQNNS